MIDFSESMLRDKLKEPLHHFLGPRISENATIGLCTSEKEVIFMKEKYGSGIDVLIALTPQAIYQCYVMKIPYYKIEDFFDVNFFVIADEWMLKIEKKWIDEIDSYLMKNFTPFEKYDFKPGFLYFFFLKVMYDMVFRAAIGLAHLLLSCKPERIVYFGSDKFSIPDTLFFNESVYKIILPAFAKTYDVTLEPLSPIEKKTVEIFKKEKFLRILKQIVKKMINAAGKREIEFRKPYILYKPGYDVDFVIKFSDEFFFKNFSVIFPFISKLKIESGLVFPSYEIWGKIRSEKFFKDPFVWFGVDLFTSVEKHLYYWMTKIIPEMWIAFLKLNKFLMFHRPQCVFLFAPVEIKDFALIQSSRCLKIPVIFYQHGGFEGYCEYTVYDMTDLRQCDYRFVYGQGVANYFNYRKSLYTEKMAHIIPVGSAKIDALKNKKVNKEKIYEHLGIEKSKKIIFYIPTSYQYHWYMSREAYLGCMYFEMLVEISKLFSEFPDVQFIYKPFPESPPDPAVEIFQRHCPNCKITREYSVYEIASISDGIVVDLPSTALLEVLLTDKPIIVFSDKRFICLLAEAKEILSKRAIIEEEITGFFNSLRQFVSSDLKILKNYDRTFLREYGTFLDDGKSAERALKKIKEITGKQNA